MEQLIKPLKGAIQRDYKRCKRKGCKCATGTLHGPYYSRVWYEGSGKDRKRKKAYIRPKQMPFVIAGITLREMEERAASLKKELAKRINRRTRAVYQELLDELEVKIDAIRNGRFILAAEEKSIS